MVEVREADVRVLGRRMHYLTAGEGGPPVVLLHGGIVDAARVSWGAAIEPLAAGGTVLAPDLPGYGRSELPDGPLPLEVHVDAVEAFLDELGLDEPVVAGLSMGGGVGLGLALRDPARVGHLVALDAYGLGRELANGWLTWLLAKVQVTNHVSVALLARSRRFAELSLSGLVYDVDALPEDAVDAVMEEARNPQAGKAFRRFRAAEVTRHGYRTCYLESLSRLAVPTTLVHGEADRVLPPRWSVRAAERIPEADLHLLEACGHWPTRERTDRVVDIVDAARRVS